MSSPCDRLDKWLWAVRLFKTRPLAVDACKAGHVRRDDHVLKPARDVQVGDIYQVRQNQLTRTVRVIGLPDNRVGAPLVSQFMEDLTPPEEIARARAAAASPVMRARGSGRPTKRERRLLDHLRDGL